MRLVLTIEDDDSVIDQWLVEETDGDPDFLEDNLAWLRTKGERMMDAAEGDV